MGRLLRLQISLDNLIYGTIDGIILSALVAGSRPSLESGPRSVAARSRCRRGGCGTTRRTPRAPDPPSLLEILLGQKKLPRGLVVTRGGYSQVYGREDELAAGPVQWRRARQRCRARRIPADCKCHVFGCFAGCALTARKRQRMVL